jgi:hypothetical protein
VGCIGCTTVHCHAHAGTPTPHHHTVLFTVTPVDARTHCVLATCGNTVRLQMVHTHTGPTHAVNMIKYTPTTHQPHTTTQGPHCDHTLTTHSNGSNHVYQPLSQPPFPSSPTWSAPFPCVSHLVSPLSLCHPLSQPLFLCQPLWGQKWLTKVCDVVCSWSSPSTPFITGLLDACPGGPHACVHIPCSCAPPK